MAFPVSGKKNKTQNLWKRNWKLEIYFSILHSQKQKNLLQRPERLQLTFRISAVNSSCLECEYLVTCLNQIIVPNSTLSDINPQLIRGKHATRNSRSCFFQSFQFAMFNFGDHGFNITSLSPIVCYTVVSVVTQRSSPLSGEERCVTTLKPAV